MGDEIRIGIFAIQEIPKGVELTYDYQLSAVQSFECKCGSEKCRGTLKKISLADLKKEEEGLLKQQQEEFKTSMHDMYATNKRLTSKQKSSVRTYLKDRLKKATHKETKNEEERSLRLNLTKKYLPGTTAVSFVSFFSFGGYFCCESLF